MFTNSTDVLRAAVTAILTFIVIHYANKKKQTHVGFREMYSLVLFVMDTLGLAIFTVIGIEAVSYTHLEHWFFMSHGKEFESDIKEPMERGDFYWPAMKEADQQDINSEPTPTKEFLEDWLVRTCEIIDRYRCV